MSSTGGGIVCRARNQVVWTSGDLSYSLTLQNDTDTDTTVTAQQCQDLVSGLDPGSYQTHWDGTNWSTPTP